MAARVKAGELNLHQAMTRLAHKQREKNVADLRQAANVSIKNCDLRCGDNVEVMSQIEAGAARVIFADPPYNNGWRYRADPSKDRLPDQAYFDLCRVWMAEAARLLAPDGSLFVLIDDRYTDHFGMLLREIGLYRQPTIIQFDTFAEYNSAETSLSTNARYLHWYTKSKKPFLNKVEARVQSERQIIKDKRGNAIGRLPPNVWPFVRVTSKSDERCPWLGKDEEAPQLPRELPERCILLASEPGDLILDPFNGNGITGIAALINDRKYVGIDRDKAGLEQSRSWISHEYTRLKEHK
jgi:site-specific DNA-methyltransferase (adenine-specific)